MSEIKSSYTGEAIDPFREESEAFLAEHGIVPIEKRVADLVTALSEEELEQYNTYCEYSAEFFDKLNQVAAVSRLSDLTQLGGKVNPDGITKLSNGVVITKPMFHTRFEHSDLCARMAEVAGVKLGLPKEKILMMATSALLHDVGHPAFCHAADALLESKGYGSHEERAFQVLQGEDVKAIFAGYNLDAAEVYSVMREKGGLGELQKALDPLSYQVIDSESVQAGFYEDSGARVLRGLDGIDHDSGRVIVNNPEEWQGLIENRAKEFYDLVAHPINRAVDAAKSKLLQIAADAGLIGYDELTTNTDGELFLRLQSLVQIDPGAAAMSGRTEVVPYLSDYKDLWEVANGHIDVRHWRRQTFDDLTSAEEFIFRNFAGGKSGKKELDIKKCFVIPPYDYTQKTLKFLVREANGDLREETFKANDTELRPEDQRYVVYYPN